MNSGKVEQRKGVKSLQIPVTDKENVASENIKGLRNSSKIKNTGSIQKATPVRNKTLADIKNNINININRAKELKTDNTQTVTGQDLTADVPSENYWQLLAESRRLALEATMKENVNLNDKVSELESENESLKEMLDEAKTLVVMLSEILEKKDDNLL